MRRRGWRELLEFLSCSLSEEIVDDRCDVEELFMRILSSQNRGCRGHFREEKFNTVDYSFGMSLLNELLRPENMTRKSNRCSSNLTGVERQKFPSKETQI